MLVIDAVPKNYDLYRATMEFRRFITPARGFAGCKPNPPTSRGLSSANISNPPPFATRFPSLTNPAKRFEVDDSSWRASRRQGRKDRAGRSREDREDREEGTSSDKVGAIKQGRVFHPLCSLAHNVHHKGAVSRFTIASGQMRAGMLEVLCCARETALAGLCAATVA